MKRQEIDRLYTELISEFVALGYTISTKTMGGSQGEVAKVDLTNGTELIRVLMDTGFNINLWRGGDELKIIVGREDGWPDDCGRTIWNDKLTVIKSYKFFKLADDYYTADEEKLAAINFICQERHGARYICPVTKFTSEAAKKAALRYIRRQPRCKGTRLDQVEAVYKTQTGGDTGAYYVRARGKVYRLR